MQFLADKKCGQRKIKCPRIVWLARQTETLLKERAKARLIKTVSGIESLREDDREWRRRLKLRKTTQVVQAVLPA